jgi:hypothetical protein
MICGEVILSIAAYYLNSYYTGILIGYPIWEQVRDIFPYLALSTLMGISVHAIGFLPFPSNWCLLITQIILGGLLYVSLCRLFRLEAFMEIWHIGRSKLSFYGAKI